MSLDYVLGVCYFVVGLIAAAVCAITRSPFFLVAIIAMAAGNVVMSAAQSAVANKEISVALTNLMNRQSNQPKP
jgi:hypothetical protein